MQARTTPGEDHSCPPAVILCTVFFAGGRRFLFRSIDLGINPSGDAFPLGAWPRDAAVTRTSKQAGKALRSQGHQYARVMRQSVSGSLPL